MKTDGECLDLIGIRNGDVHVWFIRAEEAKKLFMHSHFDKVLCETELKRASDIADFESRVEFVVGRGIVKDVLSRYCPAILPTEWRILIEGRGKPYVAETFSGHRIEFNITHWKGAVACMFAIDMTVGIDLQGPFNWDHGGIAEDCFSVQELADLRALPIESVRARFLDHWTLKEAYTKARGLGLSLPIEQVEFSSEGVVKLGPDINDDPSRWTFKLHDLESDFKMALAVCNNGLELSFKIFEFK